ncbi:MAG: hypothetical protein C0487_09325 [Leptothrix sp. (in: Bacteria)]|nr:hypothetical protein [Leptothrix sp. (in: b-proteobacteria)]
MFLPASAGAASFNCLQKQTFIEDAICQNKRLSRLDEQLAQAYQGAMDIAFAPDELKDEQRNWVSTVRNACQQVNCLLAAYQERLKALKGYADKQRSRPDSKVCNFPGLALPEKFKVFVGGGYSGRPTGFQIDQSGHEATQMDVTVHSPDEPVVLMLGAYEPTIWNLKWTADTHIVAVLVSGYHRQAIAGLAGGIPALNASYDNQSACGFFYVSENDLDKVNPVSRRLFGRPADLVFLAKNGAVSIGNGVPVGMKLLTSETTPPASFYDKTAPLAGPAGLKDALSKGLLRKASTADAEAWANAVAVSAAKPDRPAVAGEGRANKPRPPSVSDAYVVLKAFTYPSGLWGGNSCTFFVPKGVPRPKGNPGHSNVYDFNKVNCQGPLCSP